MYRQRIHKLDGILNGTIECPVQLLDDSNAPTLNEEGRPTQEAAILAWHDLDLQAQDFIFSTTETGVRRTLLDCTSSSMMWNRLTQQYEQSAPENKHVLIDRIIRYKYNEGNDVMAHVSKIESLVHQLHDMGTILGEDQLTPKVLMTLPVKYANFREAWALLPSIEPTREKMIAKLLLAESIYANHVVAVCRKRIREEKEKSSGNLANTAISDEQSTDASSIKFSYPALANTSLLSLISFVNWCADSGATRHMTDNREYFTKFVPVTHVWTVKRVGSVHKQLQVKGRGDIIIRSTKSTNMPDGILRDVLYVPGL
ncbi:uncharacterized protein LOC123471394 [Daphnia magna]|uniref:uncharacterized protein LOC123471394 n=1 Tax=Daphnia magna TaxID=35525 RepID=UPI001E1BC483|nr:uncharacterized protein LOC123471394 [Daphnia magna]